MKITAIGGEPATGKSTLMIGGIEYLTKTIGKEPTIGRVWELLDAVYWPDEEIFIFGKYEEGEGFPGTDRLSMAVQPKAKEFIDNAVEVYDNPWIIFEGDRLFNSSFLNYCLDHPSDPDFSIYLLEASDEVKKFRHKDRDDDQDQKFLKGRATKYSNIKTDMWLQGKTSTLENNNENDLKHNINQIFHFTSD